MRGLFKRFFRDERGSALPIVGLATFTLIAATGIAVDMGRVQIVQSRMSSALDSAGLAAGSVVNTADVNAEVAKYFYANFPANYLSTTITNLSATANSDKTIIALNVNGQVETTFMRLFGVNSMAVSAASEITRANKGMEVTLVLDVTGSMWTGNVYLSQRDAAADLVNILFGENATAPNLWMSVVPYVTAVNVGNDKSSWVRNYSLAGFPANYPANRTYPPAGTFWKGCVEERAAPLDVTDDPPNINDASTLFPMYFWPDTVAAQDNSWIHDSNGNVTINEATNYQNDTGLGPNISCGNPVLPFTSNKQQLLDHINALVPWRKSGTAGSSGLVWGWRMISPRWRGLWNHELVNGQVKLPHNYNEELIQKVVVIETDGVNTLFDSVSADPFYSDYGAYGRLNTIVNGGRPDFNTQNQSTAVSVINNKILQICNGMKAQGITIYTITFRLGGGSEENAARAVWRACASKPEFYFDAESQVSGSSSPDLRTAFKQIGDSLANLRVSK